MYINRYQRYCSKIIGDMAISTSLKDRKVRGGLLFLVLILLPLSLLFASWLTNLWNFDDFLFSPPINTDDELSYDEHIADIEQQLKNVKCPARAGLELKDYWECLWRTSITANGLQTHRDHFAEEIVNKASEKWVSNSRRSKRVKRTENTWEKDRIFAVTDDLDTALKNKASTIVCQKDIAPGVSIYDFVLCLRKNSKKRESFNATFQPTTIPPLPTSYDSQDLHLIKVKGKDDEDFEFDMKFEPLENHEKLSSFEGGDPYLYDQYSDYRFKYNNLASSQHQPGWSYKGLNGPSRWHELSAQRFFVPLKSNVNLESVIQLTDFAQTYPGIGEIANVVTGLKTAMDYQWSKDQGHYAYTRFLVPLLERQDIEYYQKKGLIDPSVTSRPDADTLQDIITALEIFDDKTNETLTNIGSFKPNPKFPTEEDIPYVETYRSVLKHFFKLDVIKYKTQLGEIDNNLHYEYDVIRRFLHAYVEVVLEQEKCVKEMVKDFEYRLIDSDLQELIQNTKGECIRKLINESNTEYKRTDYRVDTETLKLLYNKYFTRKEARKRYTLPVFPKEFPVCRHGEPSPLNIIMQKGRQSTLRDYVFGDAAFRLHRFFMFFPLDSSNLLTVGIVGGERLDGSSVKLTGGAVKGVNLTFQYMHIRFASHWKKIGSEHYIDGKGAQMELQMIFTISGSADEIKYWHVLARIQNNLFQFREKLVIILSVMVDVLSTDDEVKERIKEEESNQDPYLFEPFAQAAYHFHKVPEVIPSNFEQPRGYVSKDPVFRFIDFIPNPSKGTKFYTYRGSLSWPPCFGYVLWSVFEQRMYISKRQFDQFTKIPSFGTSDTNKASDNLRKLEDIQVEEEYNAPNFAEEKRLLNERTVDRFILEGFHDMIVNGKQDSEGGVVGEEFYYMDAVRDSANVQGTSKTFVILFAFIELANRIEF